jgi:hypothetical protein
VAVARRTPRASSAATAGPSTSQAVPPSRTNAPVGEVVDGRRVVELGARPGVGALAVQLQVDRVGPASPRMKLLQISPRRT